MKTKNIAWCLVLLTGYGTIETKTPLSAAAVTAPALDLKKYEVVVVRDFVVRLTNANDLTSVKPEKLQRLTNSCQYFADRIAAEFRKRKVFQTVKRGTYDGEAIVIQGYVTRYDAGSKTGRSWLPGVGVAHLDADLAFRDNRSDLELGTMHVDKSSSILPGVAAAQSPDLLT